MRRRVAEKISGDTLVFFVLGFFGALMPSQKVIFQNFQQTKQFEVTGVFQCKITPLFDFLSFSQFIQALLQKLQ